MTDYQIPLSYVVNVSAQGAGVGLTQKQLSTILLLADTQPANAFDGDYLVTRNARNVEYAYGTGTTITKMAQAIFSQNPNILNNNGYVICANLLPSVEHVIPATSGTLTTADLSANEANFASVSSGSLKLTIDGTAQAVTGIDCSEVATLQDLATLLQTKFTGITVDVVDNALVFTSTATGDNSAVTITTSTSGTDLYGSSYLDGATATAETGTNESTTTAPETVAEAITRLAGLIYFEAVIPCEYLNDAAAVEASNTVQAMQDTMLFLVQTSTTALQAGGLFYTLQSNYKTRKLLYLTGANDNEKKINAKLFASAFASRGLSTNYNGSNTTLTMTYKDLVNVPVDTQISEAILEQCERIGVDVYCSIVGIPKVVSMKQGGYYFDELANNIWLTSTIEIEVANLLFQTRNKIPQTEAGLQTITNAILRVLNQGVNNGMIGAGVWNSSDTFGILEDFHRNIRTFGYYVYHIPVYEQPQIEREERKAPLFQIAVKEQGAVEHSSILIYLEA